jgi:AcrR family transcriptional regulator
MAGKLATPIKPVRRVARTQAERRAATRRGLLSAAEKLIVERGFAAASLAEIARAAGVSKGAIYHHFRSKDDLLLALLDEHFKERSGAVDRISAAPGAAAAQRLVAEIPFDRSWNLLFLEFVVRASREERFREELRSRLEHFREQSSRGIGEFLEREGIEPELSPQQLALAVAALGNGLAIEGLTDPDSNTDPLYAAVLGLMLDGLMARSRSGQPATPLSRDKP